MKRVIGLSVFAVLIVSILAISMVSAQEDDGYSPSLTSLTSPVSIAYRSAMDDSKPGALGQQGAEDINCERTKSNKEMCYYDLALGVQNAEYCKGSGILKDDCYRDIAVMVNLPSLCKNSGGWEGDCYALLVQKNNNLSLCNEAGTVYKEYCYSKIAVIRDDVRVCNSLQGDGWRNFFGFFKNFKSQRTRCVESVKTKTVII